MDSSVNVNSRYIIEGCEIAGFNSHRISDSLKDKLQNLAGTSYDTEVLDGVARELRKDIHAKTVTQHIARGSSPEHVKVIFEVTRRTAALDISVPKFLYHAKQGWSAQVEAATSVARNNHVSFGVVSDGDELTERYAGIRSAYQNDHVGTDKLKFGFLFEDYHVQWNRTTVAADAPGTYRARQNYSSVLSYNVSRNLTISGGLSFARLAEARTEGANAVLAAVRYARQYEDEGFGERALGASYSLRHGTAALGSNYVYSRNLGALNYSWSKGRHSVSDTVTAGVISGRAPLYERFVVGTSSLLRGWNRYDIDPLGGNRLLHNSVTYRYRAADVFYDAGSLWSHGKVPSLRHSVGVGFRHRIFSLALAFPVRERRIEPVVLLGMNY